MGIADWLGIGKTIAEPIKAVGDLYTTDKARIEANAKLQEADSKVIDSQTKLQEVTQKPQLALLEIDRILSMSSNIFKSGYVPLAGWTAGFLFLVYWFPQIIIATYVWGWACIESGRVTPFPIRPDEIMNLVYVMCAGGVHSLFKGKS